MSEVWLALLFRMLEALANEVLVKAAVLGEVLGEVVALPAACRQVDGQCPVVCRQEVCQCLEVCWADVPVAAGIQAAVGDGEGAADSRGKQFCSPNRDRDHSSGRKPPSRMSRPSRHNLTTAVPRGGQER